MTRPTLFASCALVLTAPFSTGATPVSAAPFTASGDDELKVDSDWLEVVPWRSIGPATMGGRITSIAAVESDPSRYWIGTASGGLLKTTNAGTTYEHQFDHEDVVSIGQVAVAPSNPDILWIGTGESNPRNSVSYGNGVYKSTDGGETWKHMGLKESFQTGAVWIHPTDPDVVFVGALGRLYGPNEERGLFKTTDGGKKWEKILYVDDKTGVIDIDAHPDAPDVMLVATYERERDGFDTNDPAKKWGPGSGLHRSTDGGKSWIQVTEGLPSCTLGRIGVDWYRGDKNVVFAVVESERIAALPDDAAYSGFDAEDADLFGARVRRVSEGSPAEAAGLKEDDVLLSIEGEKIVGADALEQWIRERKAGDAAKLEVVREREILELDLTFAEFPEDSRGRTPFSGGLGGQRENVQDVQGRDAVETGGVYRSDDAGITWTRINSVNPRPMYYSEIRVDPSDDQHLYVLGTSLYRSKDGGKTFTSDGGGRSVHVDHHALWIDPSNGKHMILGNDGGIYVTHDRMENWDHHNHMAIGQFYHATTDSQPFYNVYGGLQDNGSWGAPNSSRNGSGVLNTDWMRIGGGDGFVCRVDREDPDQVYYESQNGSTGRWNLRTGERGFMRPQVPRGTRTRFNWETPFLLSNHAPRVFYSAGNYVFRSDNKGDNLRPISPEITFGERGSATALTESPRDPDILYVGTDDGALWMTNDGGETWTDLFEPYAADDAALLAERRTRALVTLLGALDPDGDGSIARDEVPADLLAFFDDADTNEDGVIDAEERMALSGEEPAQVEEAEGETGAARSETPAADDLVSGRWKAKLTGEGIPPESSAFELILSMGAGGKVTGSFETNTKKGTITSGAWDAEKKTVTLKYELEVGVVEQTGTIEGTKMSGLLETGGGLIKVAFEAQKVGDEAEARAEPPPATEEAPAAEEAPPAEPTGDPVSGEWKARLTGDEVPPGAAEFSFTLKLGEEGKLTGEVSSRLGDSKIEKGTYDAEKRTLSFESTGERGTIEYSGELNDSGELEGRFAAGAFSMEFEAKRTKPAEGAAPAAASQAADEPAPAEPEGREAARPRRVGGDEKKPRKRKSPGIAELLPKRMWVSSLEASRHDTDRVYVAFDGHRSDDDRPWAFVSEDQGLTWKLLSEELPRGSSRALREDMHNEDVLYLGTEFGLYVSFDRGTTWRELGKEFPTVSVHDVSQHPLSGDVLVATHGRSLWVFDATTLRQFTAEAVEADAWLFEPAKKTRWRSEPSVGASGTRAFRGQDADSNVQLVYSLEKKPRSVSLEVRDVKGEVIAELEVDDKSGIHVVEWDMRPRRPRDEQQEQQQQRRRFRRGPPVPAGKYLVVLEVDGVEHTRELTLEDDPYFPEWSPGAQEAADEIELRRRLRLEPGEELPLDDHR